MPRGRNIKGGEWKWKPRPLGPIALLLQSASIHNATINQSLQVSSMYFPDFHIINTPWQFVQKAVYYVCEGAAFHAVAYNRASFNGTRQVDRAITLSLVNNTPPHPLQRVMTIPPIKNPSRGKGKTGEERPMTTWKLLAITVTILMSVKPL